MEETDGETKLEDDEGGVGELSRSRGVEIG